MPDTERDPDRAAETPEPAQGPTRRERRSQAAAQRNARDGGKAHGNQSAPQVRRYAFRRS
jgi:hypothetical protein